MNQNLQDALDFKRAQREMPIGTKVRGNDALAAALGPTRKRDMTIIGEIVGYEPVRMRAQVKWPLPHEYVEPLAPRFLDPVEAS